MASNLIGDVKERRSTATPLNHSRSTLEVSRASSKNGFPEALHRSRMTSSFKLARQDARLQNELSRSREQLKAFSDTKAPSQSSNVVPDSHQFTEDSLREISRANEATVAGMSTDEIARERQDIIDKFGAGIEGLMAKVKEARERRAAHLNASDVKDAAPSSTNAGVTVQHDSETPQAPSHSRKIRFVEPTEADVHVYESQPSSPRRAVALLPSSKDYEDHGDISSLGTFRKTPKGNHATIKPHHALQDSADNSSVGEGTPEDIRRRFFPDEIPPENNPALTWMLSSPMPSIESPHSANRDKTLHQGSGADRDSEPRYSLSGSQLTPTKINSLPTHLGLHHHAPHSPSSDVPAGYTLSDLLLLSRSSVPAQRASVMGVLAKVLKNSRVQKMQHAEMNGTGGDSRNVVGSSTDVDLDSLRRDVLDVALDALGERGSVGHRGVDLLWEATVGFTQYDYGIVDPKDLAHVDLTPLYSPVRRLAPEPTPSADSSTKPPDTSLKDVIVSLPVGIILPMLRQHLIASPSPSSRTHSQVLEILLLLSHFSAHANVIVQSDSGHAVIAAMLEPHLQPAIGSTNDDAEAMSATPMSVHVLQALACSSRDNATKLLGPADVLLRYVAESCPPFTPTPEHQAKPSSLSIGLLEETLRFYDILSQYGLYSHIATVAQDHFSRIGKWILDTMKTVLDPALVSLSRAYIHLLGSFIICATDPHQTSPKHDILWSQVEGWGWAEWTLDFAATFTSISVETTSHTSASANTRGLWADIFQTVAVWTEGVSINGVKNGNTEVMAVLDRLKPMLEKGCKARTDLMDAIAMLEACKAPSAPVTHNLRDIEGAAEVVGAAMRLAVASFRPGFVDNPLDFLDKEISDYCISFASNCSSQGLFSLVLGSQRGLKMSESAHLSIKPLTFLLVFQLRRWHQLTLQHDDNEKRIAEDMKWIIQALHVLSLLLSGDEEHAQWIVQSMLKIIGPSLVRQVIPNVEAPQSVWEKDDLDVLLPFFDQSIRRSLLDDEGFNCVAPAWPTPQSISWSTTLSIPSITHLQEAWDTTNPKIVLPLHTDWPMLPLNHLLRSGTSPAFDALPPSWDASETDVVRASLLLARIIQELGGNAVDGSLCMSSSEAIFASMRVFMLENGQKQLDSADEVFRDPFVARWMEDLLKPFTYSYSHGTPHSQRILDCSSESLEHISKGFLGKQTPFYQFYTDFLSLYDAISFSHPLFARLLLPPISMSYPVDYRKLLFGDFGHILRTLKTDVSDLLTADVRDYLWPLEHDADVIGNYLKSLVTYQVYGMVRWIAIHHIAGNIWPDFIDAHAGRERSRRLLSAVLLQCGDETIKEVVLYRQQQDRALAPPDCFVLGEITWRKERLEWIQNVNGEQTRAKLESLLMG